MTQCLAIVSDLIFASRIHGTADKAGAGCVIVSTPAALSEALQVEPRLVLVDMDCAGVPATDAIRTVKNQWPQARVVAFFSHVQTAVGEQAVSAGADDVWPRSVFVQQLPALLAQGE